MSQGTGARRDDIVGVVEPCGMNALHGFSIVTDSTQCMHQSIIDADVNETANERMNDVDKNEQCVQVAETK